MDMQTFWLVVFLLASYAAVAMAVYLAMREVSPRLPWWLAWKDRREMNQRLAQVQRDLKAWECWRCGSYFESEQRPRPLCLCNECLDAYLQEVA